MRAVAVSHATERSVEVDVVDINRALLGRALQMPTRASVPRRSGESVRAACARAYPDRTVYETAAEYAAAVEALLIEEGFRVRRPDGKVELSAREQRIARGEARR